MNYIHKVRDMCAFHFKDSIRFAYLKILFSEPIALKQTRKKSEFYVESQSEIPLILIKKNNLIIKPYNDNINGTYLTNRHN